MPDIESIENSIMNSQARYMEWERHWRETKMMPMLKSTLKARYNAITPEMKDKLKKDDPKLHEFVMENIGA